MAEPNEKSIFVRTPRNYFVDFTNATGTAKSALVTGGPNSGSRVDSIHVVSDDTVARSLAVYLTKGDVDHFWGRVLITALAGIDGKPWIEALDTLNGGNSLFLEQGVSVTVGMFVAVANEKTVSVTALAGDF